MDILDSSPERDIPGEYKGLIFKKKDMVGGASFRVFGLSFCIWAAAFFILGDGLCLENNVENQRLAKMAALLEKYELRYKGPAKIDRFTRNNDFEDTSQGAKRTSYPTLNVSGSIYSAFEIDSHGDIFWKDTNPDKNSIPYQKSWRYLWGEERENTYDPKVYSGLRINLDYKVNPILNLYSQLVVDPWSYLGLVHSHVVSTTGSDYADVKLKYIFATGRTMNEIFRTNLGNVLNFDEIKVVDGRLTSYTPKGLYDWWTYFEPIGGEKIDERWNIIRKLWLEYNNAGLYFKAFALSDEREALTTDDVLRLSNNKRDWEESPWIDTYQPSRVFARSGSPVQSGQWVRNISAYARDSQWRRLLYLRGARFSFSSDFIELESALAFPMTYWDDIGDLNSADAAVRSKLLFSKDAYLGLVYTGKFGFDEKDNIEARNNVIGIDGMFSWKLFLLSMEIARSFHDVSEANGYNTSFNGWAYGFSLKNRPLHPGNVTNIGISALYMDDSFYPGLSNYRYTRVETERTKHLYFETPDLNDEDYYMAYGDGMDRGRFSFLAYYRGNLMGVFTDAFIRNVHSDAGRPIETLIRLELDKKLFDNLETKGLLWYKFLPDTTSGKDPLIYADNVYALSDYYSEDASHIQNSAIEADKDPSIGHFSIGARYEFKQYQTTLDASLEYTNDPMNFPRLLFYDTYVTDVSHDGVLWDSMVPFLYDQSIFGLPPYDYYSIVRAHLLFTPFEWLEIRTSFAKNNNKFATGIDDTVNHVGADIIFRPVKGLELWISYVYTRLYDLYVYNKEHRLDCEGHNNFFLGVQWSSGQDSYVRFLYGEYANYDEDSDWYMSSLDTRHIFRLVYERKF